jgi:hypothetical protein
MAGWWKRKRAERALARTLDEARRHSHDARLRARKRREKERRHPQRGSFDEQQEWVTRYGDPFDG